MPASWQNLACQTRRGRSAAYVHWASGGWRTERGDLHLAGQLSAARNQSVRLPEGFVHPVACIQDYRDTAVHALAVGQGATRWTGASGLNLSRGRKPGAQPQVSSPRRERSRDLLSCHLLATALLHPPMFASLRRQHADTVVPRWAVGRAAKIRHVGHDAEAGPAAEDVGLAGTGEVIR
jgi:hypothetical protein